MIFRIILRRSINLIEKEISETENGFHPRKGTIEGMFSMRTIIYIISEGYNDVPKYAYMHASLTTKAFKP